MVTRAVAVSRSYWTMALPQAPSCGRGEDPRRGGLSKARLQHGSLLYQREESEPAGTLGSQSLMPVF